MKFKATLNPANGAVLILEEYDYRYPVEINQIVIDLDLEADGEINDPDTYMYRTYTDFTWSDPIDMPAKSVPGYIQRFRGSQLINHMLTDVEFLAVKRGNQPALADVKELLLSRNGWVQVGSPPFTSALTAMLNEGIIDQDRHDELSKGLPEEYENVL